MRLPNLILFDDNALRGNLLPFTYSRPIADIRIGILTIREKWQLATGNSASILTDTYLSKKYPAKKETDNLLVNASVLPDANLMKEIGALKNGERLMKDETLIAAFSKEVSLKKLEAGKAKQYAGDIVQIKHNWEIFSKNDK